MINNKHNNNNNNNIIIIIIIIMIPHPRALEPGGPRPGKKGISWGSFDFLKEGKPKEPQLIPFYPFSGRLRLRHPAAGAALSRDGNGIDWDTERAS